LESPGDILNKLFVLTAQPSSGGEKEMHFCCGCAGDFSILIASVRAYPCSFPQGKVAAAAAIVVGDY